MDWSNEPNYPRPDYLSSSRKRLMLQLLFKGGILHSWKKKSVVVLNKGFFDTLPPLKRVSPKDAEIAWFISDLKLVPGKEGEHSRLTLQGSAPHTPYGSCSLHLTCFRHLPTRTPLHASRLSYCRRGNTSFSSPRKRASGGV